MMLIYSRFSLARDKCKYIRCSSSSNSSSSFQSAAKTLLLFVAAACDMTTVIRVSYRPSKPCALYAQLINGNMARHATTRTRKRSSDVTNESSACMRMRVCITHFPSFAWLRGGDYDSEKEESIIYSVAVTNSGIRVRCEIYTFSACEPVVS